MKSVENLNLSNDLPPTSNLTSNQKKKATQSRRLYSLLSESELLDKTLVGIFAVLLNVIKKASTASNQSQQSSATGMILHIAPEMFGQIRNSVTEHRDLDLRRTRIIV